MKSACIGQPGTDSFDGELPQFFVPKVITLQDYHDDFVSVIMKLFMCGGKYCSTSAKRRTHVAMFSSTSE